MTHAVNHVVVAIDDPCPPWGYPLLVLHEPTIDAGLGFCYERLPNLLPPGHHGPLVVALDSSVLVDLQTHGSVLLGGDVPELGESRYEAELGALGALIDLWLMRDIRFVLTPRSTTDSRLPSDEVVARRRVAAAAVDASLFHQFGDWTQPTPSSSVRPSIGKEVGLRAGPDRDLVLEAQAHGCHVFLTRDRKLLRDVQLSGPALLVQRPSTLLSRLSEAGVGHLVGGTCGLDDCPYQVWPFPVPDTGKWVGLLSIFGGGAAD